MIKKIEHTLLWSLRIHTVMFPYDCGTVPHSFERNESPLKHNLSSSTKPISVRKVRTPPGVFNRLWICLTDWLPLMQCHQYIQANAQPDANILFVARWYRTNTLPWCNMSQLKLYILIDCARTCNVKWTRLVVYELELHSTAITERGICKLPHLLSLPPVLHFQQVMLWRDVILQGKAVFLTNMQHPLLSKKTLTSWWLLWASAGHFRKNNPFEGCFKTC